VNSPPPDAVAQRSSKKSIARVMGLVLLALLPAVLARAWLSASLEFPARVFAAIVFALALEYVVLVARGKPWRPFLGDLSAVVTAVLLALLLPSSMPWWQLGIGVFTAIVIAKHLYGGLGENPFNPAMAGVAILLLAFPDSFVAMHATAPISADGEGWIAAFTAAGGLFLIARKIIPWQTPVAMIAGSLLAVLCLRLAGGLALSPQQIFSSGLMLAAFFVATDPVTGCLSSSGRIFFGLGAGLLTLLLPAWSGIANGLPFAILLMNCAAPWLDRHTRPRRASMATPT
jgi:electron transport complex protein RnfD